MGASTPPPQPTAGGEVGSPTGADGIRRTGTDGIRIDQVTAALLLRIQQDLGERWGVAAPGHDFLMALQACAQARLPGFMAQHGAAQAVRR